MTEINLMKNYPQSKRNHEIENRIESKTEEDRKIARKFGKEFFDGERSHGYGGYNYHPRFFSGVVRDMIQNYNLKPGDKILDIGCAKGFMLYDFKKAIPELEVKGIDISDYAIKNAIEDMKPFVDVGDIRDLSKFEDKEFDLVICITTVHNLPLEECKKAIKEIQRIGKNSFITVDAWRTPLEEKRMKAWNLTGVTFMHINDWKKLFQEVGYTGDYWWFIP